MDNRKLEAGLVWARLGFGALLVARPAWFARLHFGPDGDSHPAEALTGGMGGRDVGLGLGGMAALRSGGNVRAWLLAAGAGDAADTLTALRARGRMPRGTLVKTVAMTGPAAVLHLVVALRSR
jgi:hypothetical protein